MSSAVSVPSSGGSGDCSAGVPFALTGCAGFVGLSGVGLSGDIAFSSGACAQVSITQPRTGANALRSRLVEDGTGVDLRNLGVEARAALGLAHVADALA